MGKRNQQVIYALRDGILAHYKRARAEGIPKSHERYPKGYTISYGELIDFTGVSIIPLAAGGYLFEIALECELRRWYPIQSLVVSKKTGLPGAGFEGSAGAGKIPQAWRNHVLKMIGDHKFPNKTSEF